MLQHNANMIALQALRATLRAGSPISGVRAASSAVAATAAAPRGASTTAAAAASSASSMSPPAATSTVDPRSLEPREVFSHFADLAAIPRPSFKEGRVLAFLKEFAAARGLPFKQDAAG